MPADKREKHIGQVFTPEYIVRQMLDYAGYTSNDKILGSSDISSDTAVMQCIQS